MPSLDFLTLEKNSDILQSDNRAVIISLILGRLQQLQYTLNILSPLPMVAVDKECGYLAAKTLEKVFRKWNHPSIQSNATPV